MNIDAPHSTTYVEPSPPIDDFPNQDKHPINPFPKPIVFLLILALVFAAHKLKKGYQDKAFTIEDAEKIMSPEDLEAFRKEKQAVEEQFEECIQYILYALEDGYYACKSCPNGLPFVTLKRGEIWYIGHTCQNANERHYHSFLSKNNVIMYTNFIGSKKECHKIELKLIRIYKYLPESFKLEGKLILPPFNGTDKF